MCTGRIDLSMILRALGKGADAVLVAGCHLNECNYITHGNYHALGMVHVAKKILADIGLDPKRVRMELISGSEGGRFVEVVNDYSREARELGPLGEAEGIGAEELAERIEAASKLVPYLRLVERERLRAPALTEEEIDEYYEGEEFHRLYRELIGDRLMMSRINALLGKSPLSTAEIAEALSLTPSDVARHMLNSTRQGLVSYDPDGKRYTLARGAAA